MSGREVISGNPRALETGSAADWDTVVKSGQSPLTKGTGFFNRSGGLPQARLCCLSSVDRLEVVGSFQNIKGHISRASRAAMLSGFGNAKDGSGSVSSGLGQTLLFDNSGTSSSVRDLFFGGRPICFCSE